MTVKTKASPATSILHTFRHTWPAIALGLVATAATAGGTLSVTGVSGTSEISGSATDNGVTDSFAESGSVAALGETSKIEGSASQGDVWSQARADMQTSVIPGGFQATVDLFASNFNTASPDDTAGAGFSAVLDVHFDLAAPTRLYVLGSAGAGFGSVQFSLNGPDGEVTAGDWNTPQVDFEGDVPAGAYVLQVSQSGFAVIIISGGQGHAFSQLSLNIKTAATIHVDAGVCPGPGGGTLAEPYCSIQTAIGAAFSGIDDVEVAPGTYPETIDFGGKAIVVRSSDGPNTTIIDGNAAAPVVQCVSGEGPDSVLEGFTITDGYAVGGGGGMLVAGGSTPTLVDVTFLGNITDEAGTAGGGGMLVAGGSAPTLVDVTFLGNITDESGTGGGLFVSSDSSVWVRGGTFEGNFANGGGAAAIQGSASFTGTAFIGNFANFDGSAIHSFFGEVDLVNCAFGGNEALVGAAGSAVANLFGVMTVTNCTFSDNTGFGAGGLYDFGGTTTVDNSIFWGNTPEQFLQAGSGTTVVSHSDVQGGFTGTGNIDADPLFVDTNDLHLGFFSPCIDAGDNDSVPSGIDTDLDGNPRFHDDPGMADTGNGNPPIVDMGAFEFQGTSSTCPWDCNIPADGVVGVTDFLALLAQWGLPGSCDVDGGGVNVTDFLAMLANWGPCP